MSGQGGSDEKCGDLDCREVFRRLDDYLDGTLPAEEVVAMRDHLDACSHCADEYGFGAGMVAELKAKLRTVECPDRLRAWIAERTSRGTSGESPGA